MIQKSFESIHPYTGINSIEKTLRDNSFLVVMDDGSFLGILTLSDIIESPRQLVIDCLHYKPRVDFEQNIESVLMLMKESRNSVLPVFSGDEFIGVVTQTIITDYLLEHRKEFKIAAISEHVAELVKANEQLKRELEEHKQAEGNLQIYQKQLQFLASHLSLVEERERRRLATDLHNHIGQTLALCQIKLGALRESVSTGLAVSADGIRDLIEQTIQYTRSLTAELSPPILYELGFEAAVDWLGEQILSRQDIHFHFNDDGQPKPMEDEARILLFLAVHELMVNVAKHSQARNSSVYIQRDGNNIQIKVEDDGLGFDISKLESYLKEDRGFGLFGIRERLNRIRGHLNVETEPDKGTRVIIVAPIKLENYLHQSNATV